MKNSNFSLRKQGKSDPVIIFQLFDARFKGRKFMYSTGHHITPGDWDKRRERSKDDNAINAYLDYIEDTVKIFLSSRLNSKTLSRQDLKDFIINRQRDEQREAEEREIERQKDLDFYKSWDSIIETTKTRSGEPITEETKRSKRQTLNLLRRYAVKRKKELTFLSLDIKFYHDFDAYMREEKLAPNNRGKHFKEIKAILREATERDIPVSTAYTKKSWRVIQKDVDATYLTTAELKKLLTMSLTPAKSDLRYIFVAACFVGVRHSDWYQILRKENVVIEDGKKLLKFKVQKGARTIHTPLHPVVEMIMNQYDRPPKVISSQKFSDALKEIAQAAELGTCILDGEIVEKWTTISTHTARRSFATNAYLSKSLHVYEIMNCTGHKTETNFLKYLKLSGRDQARLAADAKFFNEGDWSLLKIA